MNKKAKIFKICMVFVVSGAFGQKKDTLFLLQSAPNQLKQRFFIKPVPHFSLFKTPVSASYYADRLGFFCKQEIKFEKVTTIPFRFRLGSMEACNKLEGKKR